MTATTAWSSGRPTAALPARVLVKDINPGPASSTPFRFFVLNGELQFTADDGVAGFELWKTDGTPAGTVLLKDISPGAGSGM